MTRLLTAPLVETRFIRPNTDILVQPQALEVIKRSHPTPKPVTKRRKRRINYAKKIQNDDFLMTI